MLYKALRKTLNSKPILIPFEKDIKEYITTDDDYYISLYNYDENHKKLYEEKNTLSGIKNNTTNVLFWDFDSKDNLDKAKEDTLRLAKRLIDLGVDQDSIKTHYTGQKGYSLEVLLNNTITPEQFKSATYKLANDLETYDSVINDSQRVVRIPNTKHPVTKNYKIPIHLYELDEMNSNEIIKLSKQPRTMVHANSTSVSLPSEYFKVEEKKENKVINITKNIDFSNRPKGWKKYKWALLQGHFDGGERHNALMVIAATARGLGYDKETTYYLCKSALKKQAAISGIDEFPKEELWKNIIEDSIFSDNWEGGQYSPTNNLWLKSYCDRMGFETEEKEEPVIITIDDMADSFKDYSSNFEKNIIKTGISLLDENVLLTTSTLNGLLGQPGAGKTSTALQFLEYTSSQNIQGVFASLDMGKPIVYAKSIQRITGMGFRDAINLYRDDPKKANEINEAIKNKYKNIGFNFRSGITVTDLRLMVEEQQQKTGEKVKLLVVDYLERLAGPYSDAIANSGYLANQLTDLSNDLEVCTLCLLQTQKHSVPDVSDPLLSLKGVKGSSIIEQGCSTILTLWRDGYNPKTVDDDRYISFALVKTRFSGLWSDDFAWQGVTGTISELTEEQRDNLAEFRKRKIDMKMKQLQAGKDQWE